MSEAFLSELLRNRCVALVGPSRSIVSSGFGGQIDGCDLVVRMNHQWPVPVELQADIGRRMDILYHCCNPDFPLERLFDAGFARAKCVCFERGMQAGKLLDCCGRLEIPALDVTAVYHQLRAELHTFPNTGLVALIHLLRFPLAELRLFGLTFYRDGYYEGYPGCGAGVEDWRAGKLPQRIWQHDLLPQYEYFLQLHDKELRLRIDERSLKYFPPSLATADRYRQAAAAV
jgi:hypothetical protein